LTAAAAAAKMIDVAPAPHTLVDLFEASVAANGPRTLFVSKQAGQWVATTYAAFGATVDQLRGGLASQGVGRGDTVGIIANNRLEWAAAAYATYGLGAVLVPMYESQKDREWAFIVQDAAVKVLLVASADIQRRVADLPREIPTLESIVLVEGESSGTTFAGLLENGTHQPAAVVHPAAGDTACLLYTSGTTGDPRGVILSHGNIVSNVLGLASLIPLPPDYRTLSFLPWAHAFGHTVELHLLISVGASMAIAEGVDRLVDNFGEVRPMVLVAVPRVFTKVYAAVTTTMAGKPRPIRWLYRRGLALARRRGAGERLGAGARLLLALADRLVFSRVRARFGGRLRFAVSGAAALAREAAELMDALGITIFEGYGLTEASPVVTANVPGARKLGTVGRPLPGVRVVIDESAGTAPGQGEVVVYGPNVMQGYHNRPEETRAVLTADGGLRTGDLGTLDADQYLTITGRIKEQYKLQNGKYVVPAPLEERLKLSPLIANVMVHGDGRPHNVALVVPQPGPLRAWAAGAGLAALPYEELLRHPATTRRIRDEIARLSGEAKGYERIAAFALLEEDFTIEAGLLTPSLKVKRRNVLARWGARVEALYSESDVTGDV
jgi:long-chain acyl-CoA synthetase